MFSMITDFSHVVSSPVQPEKIGVTYFQCPVCFTYVYDPAPLHSATPIFLSCTVLIIFRPVYTYSTLNMTTSRPAAKTSNR